MAFLSEGILSFNKQKYNLLHFEYLIFKCHVCFLARTDQNVAWQCCPWLMGPSLRCPVWDSFLGRVCLWAQSWVFTRVASGLNCSWKPSFWSTIAVCQFLCHHLQLPSQGERYDPVRGVREHGPCHSKAIMPFAFLKNCHSGWFFLWGTGNARTLPFSSLSEAVLHRGLSTAPSGKQHSKAWDRRGRGRALQGCLSNSGKANVFDIISVRQAKSVSHCYGKSHDERHFIDFCRPFERGSRFGREGWSRKLPQ